VECSHVSLHVTPPEPYVLKKRLARGRSIFELGNWGRKRSSSSATAREWSCLPAIYFVSVIMICVFISIQVLLRWFERSLYSLCSVCRDHIIIPDLGTPNRKHVKFALSPEAKEIQEAKETQDFERQKEKVGAVTKEPARYGAKTSPTAAAVGKNAGKKYPSAGLLAKPRPDRLPGSSSVPPTRPLISTDDLKSSEEAAQRYS